MKALSPLAELKAERNEILRDMHSKNIKRRSCFNGGHSPESYSFNSRLFAIQTEIDNLERSGATEHDCRSIEA